MSLTTKSAEIAKRKPLGAGVDQVFWMSSGSGMGVPPMDGAKRRQITGETPVPRPHQTYRSKLMRRSSVLFAFFAVKEKGPR